MVARMLLVLVFVAAVSAAYNGKEFNCLVGVTVHRNTSGPAKFSYHCELEQSHPNGRAGRDYDLLLDQKYIDEFHHEFARGYKRMVLSSNDAVEIVGFTMRLKEEPRFEDDHLRRKLLVENWNMVGTRTVLISRIVARDSQTSKSAQELYQGVFGDDINLNTQTKKCSFGKLKYKPVRGNGISNGVVTVELNENVRGMNQGDIARLATEKMQEMGIDTHKDVIDHIMHMIPPDAESFFASATVNGQRSMYSDRATDSLSAAMHEIGHNLGLSHSGVGNDEYADTTGYMGYGEGGTSGPLKCYDGAHSSQLGWYKNKEYVFDFEKEQLGTKHYKLFGMIDYGYQASYPFAVIVKIPLPGQNSGLYISYNRAVGWNADASNPDQVLIVKLHSSQYEHSRLVAKLGAGDTYKFRAGQGRRVVVVFGGKYLAEGGSDVVYSDLIVTLEEGSAPQALETVDPVAQQPGQEKDGSSCTTSTSCDDMDECNGQETCVNQRCMPGAPPVPLPASCRRKVHEDISASITLAPAVLSLAWATATLLL